MPKYNEIGLIANNSNHQSTSNHTKVITLSLFDAANILDLANNLQGETAIEEYGLMISDPSDEQLRCLCSDAILKFYSNVRTLVHMINFQLDTKRKE